MPIAHLNPGYGDYELQVQNAAKAPGLLTSDHYAEGHSNDIAALSELAAIKDSARRSWSRQDNNETTYQFQYPGKSLYERTQSAPTETERKNKPHPPQVFLTNRLHYVPGYHNADSTLGKQHYTIDASCSSDERAYRNNLKGKYIGGISTPAVRQYAATENDEITKWSRTLPPNDCWMASGNMKRGSSGLAHSLDSALADAQVNMSTEIASHNRYLRMAGADERARIERALDAQRDCSKPTNMMIPYQSTGTVGTQKQIDKAHIQAHPNKPHYRYPKPRGDFLIHPVWPPSVWHHRIPGFKAESPRGLSAYEKHQRTRLNGVY